MDNVIKLADGRQLALREAANNSSVAGPQGYTSVVITRLQVATISAVPVVELKSCVTVNVMAVQLVKINKYYYNAFFLFKKIPRYKIFQIVVFETVVDIWYKTTITCVFGN